jgi:hypothetical protein
MRRAMPLMIALLLLAGCSGSGGGAGGGGNEAAATRFAATLDPRLQDRSKIGKLIIAPVNLGKPSRAYLAEHEAKIDARVAARLRAAGYEILPPEIFAEGWREGIRQWGEPYNPTTGKLNQNAFIAVLQTAVRHTAENSQTQAVVFTNLEESQEYFSPSGSHNAHFLGVTRKPSSRGGEGVPAGFDWIQGVDAVSLYVSVFDMTLASLFKGAGGIEITETLDLKGSTPRWMRSKKILGNDDWIDEGVTLALSPWISD